MAQLHVRGARLEFSEAGSGDPLILVHGSSSDLRTWDRLMPEFGRYYRTLRYSRRYHWPNERIEEGLAQARDNRIEAELQGSGFAPVDEHDVRRIRHPTLLLGGERSPRIFRCVLDRLQELMPSVQRAEIPGTSHIVHEDAPEAFFDTVMGFLESHRAAARG